VEYARKEKDSLSDLLTALNIFSVCDLSGYKNYCPSQLFLLPIVFIWEDENLPETGCDIEIMMNCRHDRV